MPIIAIIAIAALVGGGASIGAENALPGSALYSIKVNFNEPVVAALSFTSEARANWEARRAERRLEEAARLAAENKMSADVAAELETDFAAHADRARVKMTEMQTEGNVRGAADVASRFEASLEAHKQILAKLESKDSDVTSIEVRVGSFLRTVGGVRADLETKIAAPEENKDETKVEVQAAAEGKLNAATNVIASVRSYLENKKAQLGADAVLKAEARLKTADALVIQGKAKIEAESYGEAFNLGNQAIRVAQESRLLVEAKADLGADVQVGGVLGVEDKNSIDGRVGNKEGDTKGSGELKLKVGL